MTIIYTSYANGGPCSVLNALGRNAADAGPQPGKMQRAKRG